MKIFLICSGIFFPYVLVSVSAANTFLNERRERRKKRSNEENYPTMPLGPNEKEWKPLRENSVPPTVLSRDTINDEGKFSILSMNVDFTTPERWYIPSMHDRYSAGYNRSSASAFSKPYACTVRFLGIALHSKMFGFLPGGTAALRLSFHRRRGKRTFWEGYHASREIHCYFRTSIHHGSDFRDNPKTLGVAIACPIPLDLEIGTYEFRAYMEPGRICRPLAEETVEVEVRLLPANLKVPPPLRDRAVPEDGDYNTGGEHNRKMAPTVWNERIHDKFLTGQAKTTAASYRTQLFERHEQAVLDQGLEGTNLVRHGGAAIGIDKYGSLTHSRPHAVCVVQSFRNPISGPLLFLFVQYYYLLGWEVIIYDRLGLHEEFLSSLIDWPGVNYHPYTAYQLSNPSKYNIEFARKKGFGNKYFYKMEGNWGYNASGARQVDDTADQDGDKTKTYDLARMEYKHLKSLLYVDSDELLFCPSASAGVRAQAFRQRKLMDSFSSLGIEEMRFVRLPYAVKAPLGFGDDHYNRTQVDLTMHGQECMNAAYKERSLSGMMSCWSSATAFDNFHKSSDFAGVCPFHYNHWSCDGMLRGGRDHAAKVRAILTL
jgi:hypothetical protein